MDHGKLTDHNGKTIDFRNVILIMTTNAGAADLSRTPIGFTHSKHDRDYSEAINSLFAPEFRNRLDAVVPFGHLPPQVIARVVDKFIMQLEAQLADRNVTIDLSDEARAWLVEHGYDEAMGARPMSRVIHTRIKTPLADEVLVRPAQERRRGACRGGRRDEAAPRRSASSIPKVRFCRAPSATLSRRERSVRRRVGDARKEKAAEVEPEKQAEPDAEAGAAPRSVPDAPLQG